MPAAVTIKTLLPDDQDGWGLQVEFTDTDGSPAELLSNLVFAQLS
jgi:hypothetical protein